MRKMLMLSLTLAILLATSVSAETIVVGTAGDGAAAMVESSSSSRTVVRFDVGSFNREAIDINGSSYYKLSCPGEANLLVEGAPDLPRLSRSIVIPDNASVTLNILDVDYVEYENMPVAPSKGNLLRTVNPDDVPYKFGAVYSSGDFYPETLAGLREPFILRNYRGVTIDINPFQYNAEKQILRVYTSVVVEVVSDGPGKVNVLDSFQPAAKTPTPDFETIYSRRFLNYESSRKDYPSVVEAGDMLVIVYDDWADEMQPFVDWKMQKGIKTTMVGISTIGNDTTLIKQFIRDFYDSTNLAYVLLVGDHAQIKSLRAYGGASDPNYALVAGSDTYPDLFIGRFSAESPANVTTQVQRTITYEQNPPIGAWLHQGTGIASNQGPGHYGEYDDEHEDLIRQDLLGFTYTLVDQIYDPSGTASQVASALNAGRSVINYTGHGSTTDWSSTGFSNTNINALTNDNMLPFIISVACVNGRFDGITCFGETWLRATNGDQPTGAIGAYMSSINQSWDPPMYAQDEVTDLLIAQEKSTFGGLCFNGSCKMVELMGVRGDSMYSTWHVFGDPSVQVRTDIPTDLAISHEAIVLFTATEFEVTTGVEGALAAIYYEGVLYGSAFSDASGVAVIPISQQLPVGQTVTLTVTAFNANTYTAGVQSISPEGPYVIFESSVVDDFMGGNGNGLVDYGESIVLGVQLQNVGPDDALGVAATISTGDPYVTITDGAADYGTVPGDFGLVNVSDAFAFDVAADAPDGHIIELALEVTGTARDTWYGTIRVPVHAPMLNFVSVAINDAVGGNANGNLDPGESATFLVTLSNSGSGDAETVAATLVNTDLHVTLYDDQGAFGDIAGQASGDNTLDLFEVAADEACPLGHAVTLSLEVTAANGYATTLDFQIIVGDRVVVFFDDFSDDLGWTGWGTAGEWMRGSPAGGSGYNGADPSEDVSPSTDNFVAGNDITETWCYSNSLSSTYWLTSPVFDLSGFHGVELRFWRWLGMESSSYDHAYFEVFDGTEWVRLYENGGSFQDASWTEMFYDVAEYADSNANFQFRFGLGSTDGSVQYCGWNIDDVELKGYGHVGTAVCVIDETTMNVTIPPGAQEEHSFWIRNVGDGTLRMEFSTEDSWITIEQDEVFVDAGDSVEYSFMLASSEILSGEYEGDISFTSNDLTQPEGAVHVTMRVGCCVGTVGNVDCDGNDDVSLADLTFLIDHLFVTFGELCCESEADLNGDSDVTLGDLTGLIDHLFVSFQELRPCP